MMAAARFPEAQAVLHAELDAVVGRDARESLLGYRLILLMNHVVIWTAPTFADWASLVELQAFILEALRWRPVNPFGLYLPSCLLVHTNVKHTCCDHRCTSSGFQRRLLGRFFRWSGDSIVLNMALQNGYCIPAGATVFGNHW